MYSVHMKDLGFEWDEAKNKENIRKHGVPFDEARTVFFDENALRFFDPDHSEDEDRFIMSAPASSSASSSSATVTGETMP